jgi:hypothetical protein
VSPKAAGLRAPTRAARRAGCRGSGIRSSGPARPSARVMFRPPAPHTQAMAGGRPSTASQARAPAHTSEGDAVATIDHQPGGCSARSIRTKPPVAVASGRPRPVAASAPRAATRRGSRPDHSAHTAVRSARWRNIPPSRSVPHQDRDQARPAQRRPRRQARATPFRRLWAPSPVPAMPASRPASHVWRSQLTLPRRGRRGHWGQPRLRPLLCVPAPWGHAGTAGTDSPGGRRVSLVPPRRPHHWGRGKPRESFMSPASPLSPRGM